MWGADGITNIQCWISLVPNPIPRDIKGFLNTFCSCVVADRDPVLVRIQLGGWIRIRNQDHQIIGFISIRIAKCFCEVLGLILIVKKIDLFFISVGTQFPVADSVGKDSTVFHVPDPCQDAWSIPDKYCKL